MSSYTVKVEKDEHGWVAAVCKDGDIVQAVRGDSERLALCALADEVQVYHDHWKAAAEKWARMGVSKRHLQCEERAEEWGRSLAECEKLGLLRWQ